MNDLIRSATAAATRLTDLGLAHALVGGLAVSVRSEPRFTRHVDLRHLVEVATPADLDLAQEATELIVARGFSRGRDLPRLLADLVGGQPR